MSLPKIALAALASCCALFAVNPASAEERQMAKLVTDEHVVAPAPAPSPEADEADDEVRDGVRARGGFSLLGGGYFAPGESAAPAFGVAARVGVQFNHYFGLYYQNSALATARLGELEVEGGFMDQNTLLGTVTLLHHFDVSAGPSVDYLAMGGCGVLALGCSSASGVYPGAHARAAAYIGGLSGDGPDRSGFALSVDAHSIFAEDEVLWTLSGGIGGEWY